jgi:hypothetical protein
MCLAFVGLLGVLYLYKNVSQVFLWMILILFGICPIVITGLFARHRLYATISVGLMLIFFVVIAFVPLIKVDWLREQSTPSDTGAFELTMIIVAWISPLLLLSVAPAKVIARRLIFLAIGFLLLIVLNEVSKLGFDVSVLKPPG